MISRKHRFHGHGSLKYVYQKGKVVRCPSMLIKYTVNPKRELYRTAVVVSKKVHKSAVVRNRIRRRLYEIVRAQSITQSIDMVFVVFDENLANIPAADLQKITIDLLKKARITDI